MEGSGADGVGIISVGYLTDGMDGGKLCVGKNRVLWLGTFMLKSCIICSEKYTMNKM